MKVLTIVHNTVCSGASKSLLNLITGLKTKHVDVKVIVPDNGNLCRNLEKENITYYTVPFVFSAYPNVESFVDFLKFIPCIAKCLLMNIRAVYYINSIVRKYKPDIIHTNVSVINVGYIVAKLNNIKHVWHIREYGDIDFNIKPFPSKKIKQNRLSDKSYTISITKDLANYFYLKDKHRTIYNGVVNNDMTPINFIKEKVFIYVGWLTNNKGIPLIITSFAKFHKKNPDYKLYLIGEGEATYISYIKSIVLENNLSESIHFLGYRENVNSYMHSAKALIVASKREGFGRITAEAMSNGCLVIGMNTGGTKEQFDNGKEMIGNEIGIRFNNEEELIEAMNQTAQMEDDRYNQIISNAQYVVHKLYSKESNILKTYNFFFEILNKK